MEERGHFHCDCSPGAKDGVFMFTTTAQGVMVPVMFLCDDCRNAPAAPVDPNAEYDEPF